MTNLKKPEGIEAPLTGAQLKAIPIIAMGGLKKEAAAVANVSPQTISAWFSQPRFRTALDASRQDLSAAASVALREATVEAVGTIIELMRHGSSETTRLKAGCYVLDHVLTFTSVQSNADAISSPVDMRKLMEALGARPQ